jgi:hypothetical protein
MNPKKTSYLILILTLCVWLVPNYGFSKIYSTWDTIEPDKCGSAWLIKRFVDKKATFKFYPKGELISSGIPFDTPEAELRRYHNMSTFESILKKYKLNDPALIEMGNIFHDIEINYWGKKNTAESKGVQNTILKIEEDHHNPNEILEKSFLYFDTLYKNLKRNYRENE